MTAPSAMIVLTVAWAAVAAFWDLRTRRIPNWLTLPAALLGLALNVAISGSDGLRQSGLGLLAGLALLSIPFAIGGMGAGDVKMLAAIGAFAGPAFAFQTFLFGALAGGLIAVVVLLRRSHLSPGSRTFPYGVAILAGVVATSATALVR